MPRKTTRNAQGGGTIRQRKDGRWEARYTVGRDPGTGKQVQRSVYGMTQAEVRKKMQAATTAIDNGTYTEPARLTVAQWCDIWAKEYLNHLKPRTRIEYIALLTNHIKPKIGGVKLQILSPHTVQTFINTLPKTGISPKTTKNIHGVLHKALEQARQIGYIAQNPATGTKLPRWDRKEIKPLEPKDIAAFMEAIQGDPYEALFMVDLFTGLRRSEILGLTWDCIDFEKGTVHVYQQLQRIGKEYNLAPLKSSKPRTISPAPDILRLLREQRRKQSEWRMVAGSGWEPWKGVPLVFTNEIGGHLSDQTVYKHFKKIMASIGLPETRLHDLRHTYAVMSLQAGDDVKTVQEHLGHYTAAFTLDVYGHVTERMQKESARKMQTILDGLKGQSKN